MQPVRCSNQALARLRRYVEALGAFDEAIACNPNAGFAWYEKSLVLGELGHSEEATDAYWTSRRVGYIVW
jgi:tetratricopeptide (TPR) repeat protein